MKHILKTIAALAILAVASPAFADEQVLNFKIIDFAPQMSAPGGKASGPWIEALDMVGKEVGIKFTYDEVPAKRLTAGLASGEFDGSIANAALAGADKGGVVATSIPFMRVVLNAYSIGQNPGITKTEDLSGKSVILNMGYAYGGRRDWMADPKNGVTVAVDVKQVDQGLMALAAGRAPIFLQYKDNVATAMKDLKIDGLQSSTISDVPIHIVISATRPDSKELVARIEAGIVKLRNDGKLPKLD
jgi:ABC-type amino acid transport substrate-binding protein